MRLRYDQETDSLYIDLKEGPGVDPREIHEGIVIDLDKNDHPVGIDIQHAGEILDLGTLEAEGLPLTTLKVAG
jgi:uncharacterized protein YuzE